MVILTEAISAADPPRLYLLNANSLVKRHVTAHLARDILQHGVDVSVITETHISERQRDDEFAIRGYDLVRRDRVGRRGGGVAVYARRQVTCRGLSKGVD